MTETNAVRKYSTKKEFFKEYKKKSRLQEIWRMFLKNKLAVIGLVIFVIIVLTAIMAPLISDYENDAIKMNVSERLTPPNSQHIFGTDEIGRDIFARIVHGARISLLVGLSSVIIALFIGGIFGAVAGFFGGKVDGIIMRSMDVFLCLPDVLLALAIVAAFGTSLVNMTIAIGLSFTPKFSRVVRSA